MLIIALFYLVFRKKKRYDVTGMVFHTDINEKKGIIVMKFVQDMTAGSPSKLLVSFSLPILAGSLIQQLYTMTDSIIVGRFVGADALAAIGACGSLTYLFFSLFFGLSAGIGIIIARYFGAGKDEQVQKGIANSVFLLLGAAILLTVTGICFARPILLYLGTPSDILKDAVAYFQITSAGILGVAFYNGISSILRALGDSKTPLIFLVIASLLNVGLDLLFVLVFHLGVAGTALATSLAQFVSACTCLIFALHTNPFFRLKKEQFRPDKILLGQMTHIGLPLALQDALIAISCVALQTVINSFGTAIVAAFTATNRIETMLGQIYLTMNTALSSYTAQNLGAGKVSRVREGTRFCVWITAAFSLCMVVLMHLFGSAFMTLFVDDTSVIQTGAFALALTSWFFIAWGLLYIFRGVLNGAGNAAFAYISGILEVVGRVGSAVLLTSLPLIGQWGIWLSEGITWILVACAGIICYLHGTWARRTA